MALIGIEIVEPRFLGALRSLASSASIPIGVLNRPGPGRLIAGFACDQVLPAEARASSSQQGLGWGFAPMPAE